MENELIEQQRMLDEALNQAVLEQSIVISQVPPLEKEEQEAAVTSLNFKMATVKKPTFWQRVKALASGARLQRHYVL